jgi:hypothetical protein
MEHNTFPKFPEQFQTINLPQKANLYYRIFTLAIALLLLLTEYISTSHFPTLQKFSTWVLYWAIATLSISILQWFSHKKALISSLYGQMYITSYSCICLSVTINVIDSIDPRFQGQYYAWTMGIDYVLLILIFLPFMLEWIDVRARYLWALNIFLGSYGMFSLISATVLGMPVYGFLKWDTMESVGWVLGCWGVAHVGYGFGWCLSCVQKFTFRRGQQALNERIS